MLETMGNMTLCGVINWNDTWEDIYCDEYGVLAFDNYSEGGTWCVTEINIGKPMPMESTQSLQRNIENGVYGECIGVIYGNEGNIVVLMDEDKAVERYLWDPLVDTGETFYYNTDEEYETESEDFD